MNTRIASKADIKSIKSIWENCGENPIFSQWFFDKIFYSENAVITESDSRPLATACTVEHSLKLNNTPIRASYIVSMNANPENKTAEVLNTLAADTLGFIAGKNIPVAFTVPDNYKFFEKCGFSLCYDYMQYDVSAEDLPSYEVTARALRPEVADNETVSMLNSVYEKFTAQKNATSIRTGEDWRYITDDLFSNFNGKCVILVNEKKEPISYMFYILRDGKIGVYELCYTCREGYEQMIGFIKSFADISLKVPSDDLLYLSFCDNRSAIKRVPFAMARVIDVKAVLSLFSQNASGDIRLQIIDRILEENNKTFVFSEGSVIAADTDANCVTDIGTFTQLAFGYLSVEEAFALNLIKGDISALKTLFKKQTTYINML